MAQHSKAKPFKVMILGQSGVGKTGNYPWSYSNIKLILAETCYVRYVCGID